MYMSTKKYLRKKANKLCIMGQIMIERLKKIDEPLNQRVLSLCNV